MARITVCDYPKVILGDNEAKKSALVSLINAKLVAVGLNKDQVKLFNMKNVFYDGLNGYNNETVVYLNTSRVMGSDVKTIKLGGEERELQLLTTTESHHQVHDDNENIIASFDDKFNNVYIYVDIADDELWLHEVIERIFTAYSKKPNPYSWLTGNKEQIMKKIQERLHNGQERLMRDLRSKVLNYEERITDLTQQIANNHRNAIVARTQLVALEANPNNLMEAIQKDIELLLSHDKVEDVEYKDEYFHIHTKELTIFDGKKEYWLGKMRIAINMEHTQILFFSKEGGKKGYWTASDPHPHVNGRGGNACLGNVADTVAELCAQNQLYALALVGIDFLESVNTSDPAGKNVVNWETVEQRTARLNNAPTEQPTPANIVFDEHPENCYECNCDDEELSLVYGACNGGELSDPRYVCETCRSENYIYYGVLGAYLSDEYEYCQVSHNFYPTSEMTTAYDEVDGDGNIIEASRVRVHEDIVSNDYTYWESIDEYVNDRYDELEYHHNEEDDEDEDWE